MIVWQGWGVLTLVIAGGTLALTGALFNSVIPTAYGLPLGLVVAAVANWFIGRWLNRGKARHKLFWIAMEWWSIALLVFAGAVLFGGVPKTIR